MLTDAPDMVPGAVPLSDRSGAPPLLADGTAPPGSYLCAGARGRRPADDDRGRS